MVSIGPRLAGAGLGLVVHPTTGAFRGMRTRLSKTGLLENGSILSSPRQAASHAVSKSITREERNTIVGNWARLCAPAATEARRAEHEARRVANEKRLLASHDCLPSPPSTKACKERRERRGSKKDKGKEREGSGSSTPSYEAGTASTLSSSGSMPEGAYTLDKDPSWRATHDRLAAGQYEEKDPRWRATHDALTGSDASTDAMPTYKRDVLAAGGRAPQRANTGTSFASFGSSSTADVAMAGIERWASPPSTENSTLLLTPRTEPEPDVGACEGRKKLFKGKGSKRRN